MRILTAKDFGEALREARANAGMSQADLAAWIQVGRHYVVSLESGTSTERLDRMLDAFTILGYDVHIARRGELSSGPLRPPDQLPDADTTGRDET